MCRDVPRAGEENAEGVEPSLHCNGNAISSGFIGTFYVEMKICKTLMIGFSHLSCHDLMKHTLVIFTHLYRLFCHLSTTNYKYTML